LQTIEELKKKLPPQTQVVFDAFWEKLPGTEKKNFTDLIQAFPSETNLLQLLLKLGSNQLKLTFGSKTRIAIVGPANVGKSTLYNQFIHEKEDKAQVSPLPGTTRTIQESDAGIFMVIDTPGADAVGEVGEKERETALSAAGRADFLIIVFDAIQGIKITELELFQRLVAMEKPYIVVLNKSDIVKKDIPQLVQHAASLLNLTTEQVIPISARTGDQIGDMLKAIVVAEPGIVAALGQALPQYRWQLAWRAIASASSVSAVIALTPLPVIDFLPLVITQSVMVLGIARIYNYKITPARARELVVSFGLGFLGRTLFYELSKLGGVPGWIIAAAVAVSMTVAMGYAATVWFERGEKLSHGSLRDLMKNLTKVFVENLKNLGKNKPGKAGLKTLVEEMLKNSPLGQDRAAVEAQKTEIVVETRKVE
jgi:small GTP-binding protein